MPNERARPVGDEGGDPPCWAHLFEDEHHQPVCGDATLRDGTVIADLGDVAVLGSGAIWNLPHGGDLDANLVRLDPHGCIGTHVNDEVDVLLFVQSGAGHLRLSEGVVELSADRLSMIPKGVSRAISAGPDGLTYLSVHRRRAPLDITTAPKDLR